MAWQYWGDDMPDPTDSGLFRFDVWNELIAAFDERLKETLGPTVDLTVGDPSAHAVSVPQKFWEYTHPTLGLRRNTPLSTVNDMLLICGIAKVTSSSIQFFGTGGWTNGARGEFWEECGTTEAEYSNLNDAWFLGSQNIPTRRTLQILRSAASKMEWVGSVYGASADFRIYLLSGGVESLVASGTSLASQTVYCQAANATRAELDYTFPASSKMGGAAQGTTMVAVEAEQRTVTGASAYSGTDRLILESDVQSYPNLFYPHVGPASSASTAVIAQLVTLNAFTLSAKASNYGGSSGDELLESKIGPSTTFGQAVGAYRPGWTYP